MMHISSTSIEIATVVQKEMTRNTWLSVGKGPQSEQRGTRLLAAKAARIKESVKLSTTGPHQ